MFAMSYVPILENTVKTKGTRIFCAYGREENGIAVKTTPNHQGDEAFPSAPLAESRPKAIPQQNLLRQ